MYYYNLVSFQQKLHISMEVEILVEMEWHAVHVQPLLPCIYFSIYVHCKHMTNHKFKKSSYLGKVLTVYLSVIVQYNIKCMACQTCVFFYVFNFSETRSSCVATCTCQQEVMMKVLSSGRAQQDW